MPDYPTHMFESDSKPDQPVSIWEVAFECDISPEGDPLEDSLDVTAGSDGMVAVEKARRYVLSAEYQGSEAEFAPTTFVLKGLRLLATGYIS